MSAQESLTAARADDLRRAFDRTFAEQPVLDIAPEDDFLAIHIAGDPYALRLSEIGGLYANTRITPLPGSIAALLGLVSLRGVLRPVYDLRALLGYSKATAPRWFVATVDSPLVLGFEQFDGHLRVAHGSIGLANDRETHRARYVREVMRTEGCVIPIIHLPSVRHAIDAQAHRAAMPKE